jgi:hypothetical protein
MKTMRDWVRQAIGRRFTQKWDGKDFTAELRGTPESLRLKVYKVPPFETGSLGRYLAAGGTYDLTNTDCHFLPGGKVVPGLSPKEADWSSCANYVVPHEQFRPWPRLKVLKGNGITIRTLGGGYLEDNRSCDVCVQVCPPWKKRKGQTVLDPEGEPEIVMDLDA